MGVVGVEADPKKPNQQILRFLKPDGGMPGKVHALRWALLVTGLISFVSVLGTLVALVDVGDDLDDVAASFKDDLDQDTSSACESDPSDGRLYCPTLDPVESGVADPSADCLKEPDGELSRNAAGFAYCAGVAPPENAPTTRVLGDVATILQNIAALMAAGAVAAAIIIPVRMLVLFVRMPRGEPLILPGIRRTAMMQIATQLAIMGTLAYIFSGVQEEEIARLGSVGGNTTTILSAAVLLWLAYAPEVQRFYTAHVWKAAEGDEMAARAG